VDNITSENKLTKMS